MVWTFAAKSSVISTGNGIFASPVKGLGMTIFDHLTWRNRAVGLQTVAGQMLLDWLVCFGNLVVGQLAEPREVLHDFVITKSTTEPKRNSSNRGWYWSQQR